MLARCMLSLNRRVSVCLILCQGHWDISKKIRYRTSLRNVVPNSGLGKFGHSRPELSSAIQTSNRRTWPSAFNIDDNRRLLIILSVPFCVEHDGRWGVRQRRAVHWDPSSDIILVFCQREKQLYD